MEYGDLLRTIPLWMYEAVLVPNLSENFLFFISF